MGVMAEVGEKGGFAKINSGKSLPQPEPKEQFDKNGSYGSNAEQYLKDNADWLGYNVVKAEANPLGLKNLAKPSTEPKEQFDNFAPEIPLESH